MSTNPYAPPQAAVQDVPGTTDERAGRGTRLVAVILDGIIFVALVYTPLIISSVMSHGRLIDAGGKPHFHFSPFAFVGLIVWAWLTLVFVSRNGQSIAKKMLGIKVVRKDGSPASLGRIFFLRNVVNTLLAIVPFYGLVDALLIFGEEKQCVHDKLADTIVVQA